jgi:hypothetical protein
MSCLACPEAVKFKSISAAQALGLSLSPILKIVLAGNFIGHNTSANTKTKHFKLDCLD